MAGTGRSVGLRSAHPTYYCISEVEWCEVEAKGLTWSGPLSKGRQEGPVVTSRRAESGQCKHHQASYHPCCLSSSNRRMRTLILRLVTNNTTIAPTQASNPKPVRTASTGVLSSLRSSPNVPLPTARRETHPNRKTSVRYLIRSIRGLLSAILRENYIAIFRNRAEGRTVQLSSCRSDYAPLTNRLL